MAAAASNAAQAKECLELVRDINGLYEEALTKVNSMVEKLNRVREVCHEIDGHGIMDYLLTDDALQEFVGRVLPDEDQ